MKMIYTVKEYAQKYKLHIKTVQRLIREGKIPGSKRIGGRWRIEENEQN